MNDARILLVSVGKNPVYFKHSKNAIEFMSEFPYYYIKVEYQDVIIKGSDSKYFVLTDEDAAVCKKYMQQATVQMYVAFDGNRKSQVVFYRPKSRTKMYSFISECLDTPQLEDSFIDQEQEYEIACNVNDIFIARQEAENLKTNIKYADLNGRLLGLDVLKLLSTVVTKKKLSPEDIILSRPMVYRNQECVEFAIDSILVGAICVE